MRRSDGLVGLSVVGDAAGHGHERGPWRRRLPALVLITVLAASASIVWGRVLLGENTATGGVRCPTAPAGAGLTPVPHRALHGVDPLPPGQVSVLVRNSTDRHRLATRVAARLDLMGFTEAAPPANDPVYPTGAMHCVGQIRFGAKGRGAARTLSLVAPCAQLVRADDTVDLVVGTDFFELSPTSAAREALRALREQEAGKEAAGGLQSIPGVATPLPASALARAYPAHC
jgi:hypothetical protein